ncbi:MAG: SRPBCC family protein [Nitriliruptorales bacterium]|nr:SRPBCC family protein [Nitriliruptorales bacterium]
MPSYRHEASTTAPIKVVWDIVQDHEGMGVLLPPGGARAGKPWLAQEGSPDRNGVGAVRRFGKMPLAERVVEFEPPHKMVYTIEEAPIQGYRGTIELSERADGGTDIAWSGSFDKPSGVVGAVAVKALGATVSSMLKKVVEVAETRAV